MPALACREAEAEAERQERLRELKELEAMEMQRQVGAEHGESADLTSHVQTLNLSYERQMVVPMRPAGRTGCQAKFAFHM